MVELMLEDIAANYDQVSGGGVTQIKQLTSRSYQISLPQEERTDLFTYEFEVNARGEVRIARKTPGTISH